MSSYVIPISNCHSETNVKRKQNNWIHDCQFLPTANKIVTAADDNCIAFHDYGTRKCVVRLNLSDHVPLTIDLWYDQEKNSDSTMLVYGTDTGIVGLVHFSNAELFQRNSKIENINLDQYAKANKSSCSVFKRTLHSDWVLKVKYYSSLRTIISCSKDPNASLVLMKQHLGGSRGWSYASVPVHKSLDG